MDSVDVDTEHNFLKEHLQEDRVNQMIGVAQRYTHTLGSNWRVNVDSLLQLQSSNFILNDDAGKGLNLRKKIVKARDEAEQIVEHMKVLAESGGDIETYLYQRFLVTYMTGSRRFIAGKINLSKEIFSPITTLTL